MKVVVGPGERDLDEVVEVGKGAFRANEKSPPDHRVDVPSPNMNGVGGRPGSLIHGRQLTRLRVLSARILNSAPVLSWSRGDQDKTGAEINSSGVNDFERKASKGFETLRRQPPWTGTAPVSSPTAQDISCPRFVLVSMYCVTCRSLTGQQHGKRRLVEPLLVHGV